MDSILIYGVVGEHSNQRRSLVVRHSGAFRKANVGISNDKAGENPAHRKTKGSEINVNRIRVSRDLRRTRKGKSMENRLIFLYRIENCDGETKV